MKRFAKPFGPKNNIVMLNNKLTFQALFWVLLTILTYLLLIELKPTPQTWPTDKLQHVIVFVLLTYFGRNAYPKYGLYLGLGLASYGGLMELLQTAFTHTRTGNIADWLADLAGILLGVYGLNMQNKNSTNLQ